MNLRDSTVSFINSAEVASFGSLIRGTPKTSATENYFYCHVIRTFLEVTHCEFLRLYFTLAIPGHRIPRFCDRQLRFRMLLGIIGL